MRFRIVQDFSGDLASVEDALIDPGFLDRLASLPSLGKPELLSQEREGDVVRQQVRYGFVGNLNAAARAVIDPSRLTWIEDSVADLSTHITTFRILPDHYADRLECSGTFTLEAVETTEAGGRDVTRRVAEGTLKVHAALVAGKVERAIVSGLGEHAGAEVEALDEWLQELG